MLLNTDHAAIAVTTASDLEGRKNERATWRYNDLSDRIM